MGKKSKKFFSCVEIIFNSVGQIYFKKRFILGSALRYFRYVLIGS